MCQISETPWENEKSPQTMSKSEESGKNSWDFFHGQSPRKIHGQSPWPRSGGSANVVGRWKPPALDEIFSDARSMIWMMTGGTPMTWERNHHAYLWYIYIYLCLECIQYTYIHNYIYIYYMHKYIRCIYIYIICKYNIHIYIMHYIYIYIIYT